MKEVILFDSHVHIYDCFGVNRLLTAAYDNFSAVARQAFGTPSFSGVLLLTETRKDHWFEKFASRTEKTDGTPEGDWHFEKTHEPCTMAAISGERHLYIVAGRQVVTAEDLEVLALCSRNTYADGRPIDEVIDLVRKQDGIPVIPWGTGKWWGRRGKILNRLLENRHHEFLLGDNSGRPIFWTHPDHFKKAEAKGIRILPGSDPLPFPKEVAQVASFGAAIEAKLDVDQPAYTLKELIASPDVAVFPYGDLESPLRFFKNQIAMQLVKRARNKEARTS